MWWLVADAKEECDMRVRVLPSLTDPRSQLLITFVVNDCVAIDAGALAFHLTGEALLSVQDIVLTHVHLDHIASLPFIFSEMFASIRTPVRIHATAADIERLRRHIFNDVIWPDFTRLRNAHGELLTFVPFTWREPFRVAGLRLTAIPVTHTVETAGLIIEDGQGRCVAFTSDTGVTDEFWEALNALPRLDAVFVDVAFDNANEVVAKASCHLSPRLLVGELAKLRRPSQVLAVNLKPFCREQVQDEVRALALPNVRVAELDMDYTW
ncbi:3',5'-cyclic-nucleotide phosphodiesterase [Chloracidobacterium aggregatum]|uniref:3',5'-cyclic-nucleotide phosphodiesterase n=2 Tax=Chloracidobacterium aggregatum TaxID=2851959 RepID=UPI001B8B6042|nr:3',5'-cyclic-nucleotide phosphodiesterase [Chloracidobacterium aggregatum]QUV89315.1 3',5'-cyclic-nucleotide phosphodiesterase [Chloracidobacterium sp. S]QUV98367.1 3',5'-cyclic-nucleotide phosphodiesterase [Chloracidobacterium sp. E]